MKEIKYINRKTKETLIEDVPGEGYLKFLYYNPFGKLLLNLVVKRKILTYLYGKYMNSSLSKKKIGPFIKNYNINMDESLEDDFSTFNDFFIRKLKKGSREFNETDKDLLSPSDGKVLAYEDIAPYRDFFIKGERFTLSSFLRDDNMAREFTGGTFVVIRLAPTDYHRYHFPLDGVVQRETSINGHYLSVSPFALYSNLRVFCQNKRSFTYLENKRVGKFIQGEIGATMVGGIHQTYERRNVSLGQEKGYFDFGGSTCILLFKKGAVTIHKDILENTKNGLESKVLAGEKIGGLSAYE